MASIGQTIRTPREIKAYEALDEALTARDGFAFSGFEPASGGGVIAVVVNGTKVIMHLGYDEAHAVSGLAALALRPLGRDGR